MSKPLLPVLTPALRGDDALSFAPTLPWETIDLTIGDRIWQITCVRSRAGLAADADHLEHDLYGFLLWESAVGLARRLTRQTEQIRGKQV